MGKEQRCLRIGPHGRLVDLEGREVDLPPGWVFLPAGDAGLTRKVTANTVFWRVQAQMGRRIISKGIWAPEGIIEEARAEIEVLRASESYQQKLAGDRRRRAAKQLAYEDEFFTAVCSLLNFAPCYLDQQRAMAEAITRHAVPVGSGTVARTVRIPIEERASRAVIAWMRHQTTAYDSMSVARIKGERRRVRRLLAQRSVELLEGYRLGRDIPPDCPLMRTLKEELPAAPEGTAESRVKTGALGG
jgi:hypothetical protein